jgi:hypothetical protein
MASGPMNDFQHFVAAVKVLSTGGEHMQQANEWLMNFKNMPAAWTVTMQCLSQQAGTPGVSADELLELHFQSAVMLKSKIQTGGDDLPAEARLQLRQRLVVLISNFHAAGSARVALQLCIALANLAVVDDTWKDVVMFCAQGFSSMAQREMLLDVLKYFPEQLHQHDRNTISIDRLRALQDEMHKYSPHVLKLIQASTSVLELVQKPKSLKVRVWTV